MHTHTHTHTHIPVYKYIYIYIYIYQFMYTYINNVHNCYLIIILNILEYVMLTEIGVSL